MRKNNEQLVSSYVVNIYADTDKLNDPTGSGSDSPAAFSQEVTAGLSDPITEAATEHLSNFSNWDEQTLRCEVTPIT